MANNYYDMTGVLLVKEVTPVVEAFFGMYELDGSYPKDGQAYIAKISETTSVSWDDVAENLVGLANTLGVAIGEDDSIAAVLRQLAGHFKLDGSRLENLNELIDAIDFKNVEPELECLLHMAQAFDDGHGLKGYKTEAAWHCSKPRLFEFGGAGEFVGAHVAVYGGSSQILELGESLESALLNNDVKEAASILLEQITLRLDGIYDAAVREQVHKELVFQLAASPSSAE